VWVALRRVFLYYEEEPSGMQLERGADGEPENDRAEGGAVYPVRVRMDAANCGSEVVPALQAVRLETLDGETAPGPKPRGAVPTLSSPGKDASMIASPTCQTCGRVEESALHMSGHTSLCPDTYHQHHPYVPPEQMAMPIGGDDDDAA